MGRFMALAGLLLLLAGCGGAETAKPLHLITGKIQRTGDERTHVFSYGCGIELWDLKTGSDNAAKNVSLTRQTWTSLARMNSFTPPSPIRDARVSPVETTVYYTTVKLISFKEEADSDLHLQLVGSSGFKIIGEIPSPSCADGSSPFLPGIAAARTAFESQYAPSGSWQNVNRMVRVAGVGLFDFGHGQSGAASNYVEFHPILSIAFR